MLYLILGVILWLAVILFTARFCREASVASAEYTRAAREHFCSGDCGLDMSVVASAGGELCLDCA